MRSIAIHIEAINQEFERGFGVRAGVCLMVEQKKNQHGFTLVELITVMVIVGILAVSVLPRFFTVSDFEDRGSADQVKSMLRFAQKTAIAQHRIVSVAISTAANTEEVNQGCTTTLSGGNLICKVKSTVATKTVRFDALGRPVDVGGAPLTVKDTIDVGGRTISIQAETGYVHE
jgi:MSHA pilin protein MshC